MEGGHIYYHNTQCYSQEIRHLALWKNRQNIQYFVTLFLQGNSFKNILILIFLQPELLTLFQILLFTTFHVDSGDVDGTVSSYSTTGLPVNPRIEFLKYRSTNLVPLLNWPESLSHKKKQSLTVLTKCNTYPKWLIRRKCQDKMRLLS
jgi:hypothetical protein